MGGNGNKTGKEREDKGRQLFIDSGRRENNIKSGISRMHSLDAKMCELLHLM